MNTQKKKQGMKKKLSKILKILAVVLLVVIAAVVVMSLTMKPKRLEVANVDPMTISDGVYIGSTGNGMVKVRVSVEMNSGVIQDITILEHDKGLGARAEAILDDILAQQSLAVDAITSATYSSDTIRKAVENALHQGE